MFSQPFNLAGIVGKKLASPRPGRSVATVSSQLGSGLPIWLHILRLRPDAENKHPISQIARNGTFDSIQPGRVLIEIYEQDKKALWIPPHLCDVHACKKIQDPGPTVRHIKHIHLTLPGEVDLGLKLCG